MDDIAVAFVNGILSNAKTFIQQKHKVFTLKSHPWMTAAVMEAIRKKCEAHGTDDFQEAAAQAQVMIAQEYKKYQHNLRETMAKLPRSSKNGGNATESSSIRKRPLQASRH